MDPPPPPEPSSPDAGEPVEVELARLAEGLRAEVNRRRWAGMERVVAPPSPEPPAPEPVAPKPVAEEPEAQKPAAQAPAATGEPSREVDPPSRPGPASPPESPATSPVPLISGGEREEALVALRAEVAACEKCELCRTRTQTVFADGSGKAGVMFIGEAPGQNEDEQGVPFVGRAGALLTDIIQKGMGLRREEVYIANVLKCRPPQNRDPKPEETRLCTPYLDRQIELVDPQVLIPLGLHASQHVLHSPLTMGRMRGRVHEIGGRKVVATYHPAYLLRSPNMKKECWKDIQLAMAELGIPVPRKG